MKATWPPAALGSHSSSLAIFEVGEISINSRGKVNGEDYAWSHVPISQSVIVVKEWTALTG